MSADVSELKAFADDLRKAAVTTAAEARKVVTKAGLNIKADARKTLRAQLHRGRGGSSLDWLPIAISYDIFSGGGETVAEVGPDQAVSGLGVGTERGSRHHAPMPFLVPAFDREAPKFEAALGDVLGDAFK